MADDGIDAAAEDPPLAPLAGAVAGVLLAVAGLGWLVLSLAIAVPGAPAFQGLLVVGGVVCFAASMLWWDPDVER